MAGPGRDDARLRRPRGPASPGGDPRPAEPGVRVQKALADAGVASRRRAEDLIRAGRVTVNGQVAVLGQRVVPTADRLELDGIPVHPPGERHYYALNKPTGVVTTSRDPRGRTTVIDLMGVPERVFPVGRLDVETEGLLIVTDDGELAQRLTHPSFELPKVYVAEVAGVVRRGTLRRLTTTGIEMDGERPAVADAASILEVAAGRTPRTVVEITLHEGRNRVVRRMLEKAGHPVQRLVRTGVGPLRLGRLSSGTYRKLSPDEVTALYRASEPPAEPGRRDRPSRES